MLVTVTSRRVVDAISLPRVQRVISTSAHAQKLFCLTQYPVYVTTILGRAQHRSVQMSLSFRIIT